MARTSLEASPFDITSTERPQKPDKPFASFASQRPTATAAPEQMTRQELLNWSPQSGRRPGYRPHYAPLSLPGRYSHLLSSPVTHEVMAFQPFSFDTVNRSDTQAFWPDMTAMGGFAYNADEVSTIASEATGENMVDLSAYKDLTSNGSTATQDITESQTDYTIPSNDREHSAMSSSTSPFSHPEMNEQDLDLYTEFSGNVKTLVQLVNDLPEGVTKQTGAQIIRLTMEAMGISMENVLSDAQAVQSELLEAVRTNIKKIEEFKTVIRKLETEIRFHQGKANELSEIIDLFILTNTSPNFPNMGQGEGHY